MLAIFVPIGAFLAFGLGMLAAAWTAFGSGPTGERLDLMQSSAQHIGKRFDNPLPKYQAGAKEMISRWMAGAPNTIPKTPIAIVKNTAQVLRTAPTSGLRITWLGHSSMLVEIDGKRILIDPVFSDRASPWQFFGPERFHAVPLTLDELPPLDAVVLSHDHYDHLDEATIIALSERVPKFLVPLGIGAHLEYWGVSPDRIVELDWWQDTKVAGLVLTATPARHFSGRSLWDANRTLWAGWAIAGPKHRVYYSGDTAMFPEIADIGKRLGPFDANIIEVGAYSADWPDVHLGPEQAVDAHQILGGGVMFPVHWGTFDLALHPWTEPIERTRVAANKQGVTLAAPKPGESIEPASVPTIASWWPTLPWSTAEETPVVSTGLPPRT